MPFHVGEPLLLLHVARSCDGPDSLYDAVRFAWRLNVERARDRLVLAHGGAAGGGGFGPYEVVGAFRPRRWLPATPANFPELPEPLPGRWGFIGAEAECWAAYVGQLVPERYRGGANPVRYCEPPPVRPAP